MVGPVVVMSALDAELKHLRDFIEDADAIEVAGYGGWSGTIDGRHVVLVRAGLGKVATGTAVGVLWQRFAPRVFIFSGVAGGLDPDLSIGDIVIGDRSIQHDSGVIGPDGLQRYQAGHVPFFNPTDELGYTPSRHLLDRVRSTVPQLEMGPVLGRVPSISFGTILTGDQYLNSETVRADLHQRFGAAAVEMEGAAMAQAAVLVGADHLVIRALSDLAGDESISDFGRYVEQVSANTASVVRQVLMVV